MMEFPLGRWWQRGLAVLTAGLSAWLYFQWTQGQLHGVFFAASCVVFFLFFLFSFPALYRRWMAFAERLSVWIVRTIFVLVYFLVLPFLLFFQTKDRLRLKRQADSPSLWRDRAPGADTLDSMQRMG